MSAFELQSLLESLPQNIPFTVLHSTEKGIHCKATQLIKAGTVIIEDQPIIVTQPWETFKQQCTAQQRQLLQQLADQFKCQPDVISNAVQCCIAGEQTINQILKLYKPTDEHKLKAICAGITENDIKQLLPFQFNISLSASLRDIFVSLLLIHNVNNMDNLSGRTGVYQHLSRLSHSCTNNATNLLKYEPLLTSDQPTDAQQKEQFTAKQLYSRQIRAVRDIQAGEEITISYLSPQDLIKSALYRNNKLRAEWQFTCTCSRCQSIDLSRVFKCSQCDIGRVYIIGEGTDANDYQSDCNCKFDLPAAVNEEKMLIDKYDEMMIHLRTSQTPDKLIQSFQADCQKVLSSQHWLQMETQIVIRDLYSLLKQPVKSLAAARSVLQYLSLSLYRLPVSSLPVTSSTLLSLSQHKLLHDQIDPSIELLNIMNWIAEHTEGEEKRRMLQGALQYAKLLLPERHETLVSLQNSFEPTANAALSASHCCSPSCSSTSATLVCSRCKSVRYCSRDCQKLNWRTHKLHCKAAS